MADANPPIVGNAAAFERSAKAILARAEIALRQSVQTLAEVRGLASQIEAAGAASQGEAQAAEAINRKANAAERAAAAVALQNQRMREAASAARGEEAAAVALERKAAAAERAAAAMAEANAVGVTGTQRAALAEQRLAELRERNAEIERSTLARASIVTGAQAQRQDARLGYQEQVPLRRQQGADAARVAAEQASVERRAVANAAGAARGYQMVAAGAGEADRAVRASAVGMATSQARAEGLGRTLLHSAADYGKFAVATGGLFAVVDIFKHVYEGAAQSQQGVQALRRVMEHVDPGASMEGFARLSREVNVPIKDAAEATQLMARQFQNLPDALAAARVALGFTKLDAISTADSVRFLGAAAQAFKIAPGDLERRVADPIEQVARRGGEPPAQILRAFAASAQVANAGGAPEQLAGLVGAAIRASAQTGNVIATAFQRSIANAVPRASAQEDIKHLGLDPREASTNYTQFLIHAIQRSRDLDSGQRRQLALAIGGKFYGSRVFEPLFERPEQSLHRVGLATGPGAQGAFAQELHEQLKRVDEQITAIGNSFQRLGEQLERARILDGVAHLLTLFRYVVDEAERFVSVFNAVVPDPFAPWLVTLGALAVAWRGMRALDVGGRLARQTTETGLIGRYIPAGTRDRVAAEAAGAAERDAYAQAAARARADQLTAAVRYRTTQATVTSAAVQGPVLASGARFTNEAEERAYNERLAALANANNAARERFIAADRETLALLELEAGIANGEAITAETIAAARARSAGATGAGAGAGAAGTRSARSAERDALEAMGFGAAGAGVMGKLAAGAESRAALEAIGIGRAGSFALGGLGSLSALGPMVAAIAPLAAILEGINAVSGFAQTKGNALERVAGAGRAMSFGLVNIPITGAENRAAGAKAADQFIRGLGPTPASTNFAALNRQRTAITRELGRIDASGGTAIGPFVVGGPDTRKAAEETKRLNAELDHLTRVEQAAAAAMRSRRGGSHNLVQDLMGLNSKELGAVIGQGLRPLTTVGDDRGLATSIAGAEAFAKLGHQKGRDDLLDKADQAIRQVVSAISGELDTDLKLAHGQAQRQEAYADAYRRATKLLASASPDARRQGRVLLEDINDKVVQDFTQRAETNQGTFAAEHRDPTAVAQRAAESARRVYEKNRDTFGAKDARTRQAFQKYQEARNAANDAALQDIELDTATAQANATTARGKDQALVTGLTKELAKARSAAHPDTAKITELTNQLADGKAQLTRQTIDDANAATDAYYAYLEAQTDEPLQQALYEQQRVAAQKPDKTDPNWRAKQRTLNAQQAQRTRQALHQDAQDRVAARYDRLDALGDPSDTVAVAERAERRARDVRRRAPGLTTAERARQDNDVRRTHAETLRARQQAAYDDIQHNANVGKLTTDMEVSALRRMLSTVHRNKALRRQIEEQIYSLTHQDSGQLELQLGNIRLPSPYEVNRAIREGGSRASVRGMAVHNSVHVTVTGDTDLGKMANAIDGVVGTSTRSALRAAGVL